MSVKARVTVTLKNGVLDPQGQAIRNALKGLDFPGIASVRQGKVFDIALDDTSEPDAEKLLQAMCEKLLANTVIEDYTIRIIR
ncbi:MAG TPA: phosphoribosylformylglycinamidine synthase subunit PurS [Devosia sp.]|nr:phosphoribosylformylglycinamidine synthase subunit PurS [Devosia sp.]